MGALRLSLLATLLSASEAAATVVGAADVEIDNYTLVSSRRISRTIFEYTYNVDVSNWGSGDATITATLASATAQVTVVEGGVSFGDVDQGATQQSADTFTIRRDRSLPFDEDALVWTAQATPLPPSTVELIEDARSKNLIDAETALIYRVYNEFGDARLPAQYLGRDAGPPEAVATNEAEELLSTLSPASQQILAPFLADPVVSGSPAIAPGSPSTQLRLGKTNTSAPAAIVVWTGKWVVRNELAVYWDGANPAGESIADQAIPVMLPVWTTLTRLFPRPAVGNHVGVYLDYPSLRESRATSRNCTVNPRVHMALGNRLDKSVYAHELTHALLYYAYPTVGGGCNQQREYSWLHEATAQWAEHFVDPSSNVEQTAAKCLLFRPTLELEKFETTRNCDHQYGAYLWFLFITNGDKSSTANANTALVTSTWLATASHDSLGAINAVVPGGLVQQWPQFALYNWNRVPNTQKPYRFYNIWDTLRTKAHESTSATPAGAQQLPKKVTLGGTIAKGFPLFHKINHLGAEYWHFDFTDDENIRRVRVQHPYYDGSQPKAKVHVILNVRGYGWLPAMDFTGFQRKTLCRDIPQEDVEELVVVISNAEYQNRNHVLEDSGQHGIDVTLVEVSAFGCRGWKGSVSFETRGPGILETGTATDVTWQIHTDRFSAQQFMVTGGAVQWSHSGSSGSCAGSSSGGYLLGGSIYPFEASATFANEIVNFLPINAPGYVMFGSRGGVAPPDDYLCTDGSTIAPNYGSHDIWMQMGGLLGHGIFQDSPGIYDFDPTGETLAGSSVVVSPLSTTTHSWFFKKDATFVIEPEQ